VTVSSVTVDQKDRPGDPIQVGSMTISNVHESDSIVALPYQIFPTTTFKLDDPQQQ
jgi:hypothetical protein